MSWHLIVLGKKNIPMLDTAQPQPLTELARYRKPVLQATISSKLLEG